MADYGGAISLSRELSHTSDDSSSDHSQRSVPTPSTLTPNYHGSYTHQSAMEIIQRKPRGRPPGSKNKPKPPVIITKDSDSTTKPAIIEISAGSDVIETIINFACKIHSGISVISASGSVSDVTLRHPLSPAPSLSLNGTFNLLSLSGSFLGSFGAKPCSTSGSVVPGSGCFGISLAGAQGQVFGGIVAGKVIAASPVILVAATFINPTYHRLLSEEESREDAKQSLSIGGANDSGRAVSTGMSMSVYGVANPSPISPPEIMNWVPPRPSY